MKKKLKFLNVKEDQTLSRYDMKSIMAGSGGGDGGNCTCLYCSTPGGTECWQRIEGGNPVALCQQIYPKYGSNVNGAWWACSPACTLAPACFS